MEIKFKLYPYPVLSPYSNDYKNGRFDTAIDVVNDGYNLKIDFMTTSTNNALINYIKMGSAKYVYHLECAQTGFRKVVQTDKISTTFMLSNKKVNGKLQICPFIVATKDIKSYSNPDFHDDYRGTQFDIDSGCVLAVGKMTTVDIRKDIDELANTPSIFSIIRNADTNCHEMLIDMSERKIIIMLPLNDYYSFKQLSKTPQAQALLNSLTVLPALIYVLEELKNLSINDRLENEELLWYRVLSKTLLTQFDYDIESDEFNSINSIELAQKLINDPISDAFQMLTSNFDDAGGDEL